MTTMPTIRPATLGDIPAISVLLRQLGYPAPSDRVAVIMRFMVGDRRHAVLLAEDEAHRPVAMLSVSCRPVLRLQGWVGTIEELVVTEGSRGGGLGDRLIQYAKGLAVERGWVRLEAAVTRRRESHRRGFFLSRGFVTSECVPHRWGTLEGHHQPPLLLEVEPQTPEFV